MTILDKETETNTKKSKKKTVKLQDKNKDKDKKIKEKKKQPIWFYKILSFLLVIITIITLGVVIYNELVSIFVMLPIVFVVLLIVYVIVFILNKRKLRMWVKNIFSLFAFLIIILDLIMMFFGTKTLKFLANITDTGYRVETYGVYVLKNSNYKVIEDLSGKSFTYLNSDDDENVKEVIDKIDKKIDIDSDYEDGIDNLVKSLIDGETDAIIFEVSYEEILKEEYEDYYKEIRLVDTYDIVDMIDTVKSDVDITKDPFVVYVSGIDTTGNIQSKARSDVNLLIAVNPSTRNILMINTPRDYYVTLHTSGQKDKLTHSGIYGIEESIYTLEDFYDIEIDYYVRANFTSVIKMIDALDGIKVDVPVSFCEQNSDRSFKKQDLICLDKGYQTLDGEQALALARHRKTLPTGDRARGNNQMLVLEAMINKAMSPKILTKYSSLINALQGRVTTNVSTDEMYKFAKKQLKTEGSWTFTKLNAKGTDSRGSCYSVGSAKAYVMEPDEGYVETIKQTLYNLMNGKTDIKVEEKVTKTTSY